MSPRYLLVDDMLDDLDSTDLFNLNAKADALDDEIEKLDFPNVWEMYERKIWLYRKPAERDRAAKAMADERKLNPSANRKRVRKNYWQNPEVARAKARERKRKQRARARAARSS